MPNSTLWQVAHAPGELVLNVWYFSFIVGTQNEPQIMAGCTKTIPCPLASAGAALSCAWKAPVPGAAGAAAAAALLASSLARHQGAFCHMLQKVKAVQLSQHHWASMPFVEDTHLGHFNVSVGG